MTSDALLEEVAARATNGAVMARLVSLILSTGTPCADGHDAAILYHMSRASYSAGGCVFCTAIKRYVHLKRQMRAKDIDPDYLCIYKGAIANYREVIHLALSQAIAVKETAKRAHYRLVNDQLIPAFDDSLIPQAAR